MKQEILSKQMGGHLCPGSNPISHERIFQEFERQIRCAGQAFVIITRSRGSF